MIAERTMKGIVAIIFGVAGLAASAINTQSLRQSRSEPGYPSTNEQFCMCICREARRPLLEVNPAERNILSVLRQPQNQQQQLNDGFCKHLCQKNQDEMGSGESERQEMANEDDIQLMKLSIDSGKDQTLMEMPINPNEELQSTVAHEIPKSRQRRNTYARYYGGGLYGYGYGMYDPFFYSPFYYY